MRYDGPTRFKGDTRAEVASYRDGADRYPRLLTAEERLGFKQKPLDWNKGHPHFINAMYQILNGIQAMNLEPGATIVEVGSGAGWVTELLAGLRYRVECVEPAELMVEAAKERVPAFLAAHAMGALVENVRYHCTTFEESELDAASADAVLFFESFHHVIDEHTVVANCARVLRPGGVACILGDSNWVPGYREQEALWVEEMERFGTLESPFTHGYLVALLEHHGFGEVTRHHGVNGLVPIERETEPVVNFAGHLNATYVNLVTARKLGNAGQTD